jgi:hypothetical protein
MSCSEKFYIAVTQFQDFETSLAGLLKQALIVEDGTLFFNISHINLISKKTICRIKKFTN